MKLYSNINRVSYIESKIKDKTNNSKYKTNFKLISQGVMLGDILFLHWLHSLAQEVGFHFVLEEVSRFYISNGVWDIIPDLYTYLRKAFYESSNRGFGIWKSCILRVLNFEIWVLFVSFPVRISRWFFLRILCQTTPESREHRNFKRIGTKRPANGRQIPNDEKCNKFRGAEPETQHYSTLSNWYSTHSKLNHSYNIKQS